jgi:uncharacterized membrane protein
MTNLDKIILEILEIKEPKNVRQLINLVQEQINLSTERIENEIKLLQKKGLVAIEESSIKKKNFFKFLFSKNSIWFWIIIVTSMLSFFSINYLSGTGAIAYIRYVFGFILAAFLPGYCLTETLFPKESTLDMIERITFSIGLSFAITALMGLFLSFTSIGLNLSTTLLSLGSLVIILAIIALIRKFILKQ